MDAQRSIEILSAMFDGVDPFTKRKFDSDHICNHPEVVRALYYAIEALEAQSFETARAEKRPPENRGKPWLAEDDLLLRQRYRAGESFIQLGYAFGRSANAIRKRLIRLGEIHDDDEEAPPIIDNDDLRYRFLHGETVPELAARFNLSEKAIRARLYYMGLGGSAPDVMAYWKRKPPMGGSEPDEK